jgi:serine/threonine protein kinase
MDRPDDRRQALEETQDHAPSVGSGADETVAPSATARDGAAPTFAPPRQPDEVGVLGPYRVVKELGRGGMGAVYAAVDSRLDRKLALKVMLPQFAADAAAKERFLREARAAAQIAHDNVVTVYEADERDGVPYIAMQFLQGYSLDEYLKKKGSPKLPQIVRIAREAAAGLAAAHRIGLVHRDVKPANLWLEAPNGRVKVLDFGLARPVDAEVELTRTGAVVGTPAYMSPEQARGLKVDHRTDLFSLGVLLYRLCTGRLPFRGPNTMALLMALGTEEPTPVRALNDEVPESLAALIHRMLSKRPDERPASAEDVAKRLREIAESLARPSVVADASSKTTSEPIHVSTAPADNPFADLKPTRLEAAGPKPADVPRLTMPKGEASGPPSRAPTWVIALACGFLLPLAALGIIFYWETPDGVVRFEINDPQVKVTIGKDGPTITGADPKPITLKPGKHGLTITRGDFTFDTKAFELNRGDESVLKVEWLPGKVQVSRDGKILDAKERPSTTVVADPDRRFAERTLELGGVVQVVGEDRDITKSADLPQGPFALSSINLTGTRVIDNDLEGIDRCQELAELALADTTITDGGLAYLKNCRALYKLWLHGARVTDDGLVHLKDLPRLYFIHLGGTGITGVGLEHLSGCKDLGSVSLQGTPLTDAGVARLQRLQGLAHVNLVDTPITDAAFAPLERLPALTTLEVGNTRVTAKGVEDFRKAKPGCTVIYKAASEPAADPDRQAAEWVLSVGGYLKTGSGNEIRSADKLPAAAFKVAFVSLSNCEIKKDDLQRLSGLTDLGEAYLHNTAIDDDGLERLAGLVNLRALHLGAARITDRGAKRLAGFKRLTWLNLSDVNLTDQGVNELAALDGLTSLRLVGTRTTDAGLTALRGLKTLIYLNLRKTGVTAKGVADFHAAVPSCRVDYDGGVIEPAVAVDPKRAAVEAVRQYCRLVARAPTGPGFSIDAERPPPEGEFVVVDVFASELYAEGPEPPPMTAQRRQEFLDALCTLEGAEEIYDSYGVIGFSADDLARLAASPAGKTLRKIAGFAPTVAHLEAAKKFPHLESLRLSAKTATDADLRKLEEFPRLDGLGLNELGNGAAASDAALAPARQLPVRTLALQNSKSLKAAWLRGALTMPKLERIRLTSTNASDDLLRELAGAKSIDWLDLDETAVTDACIDTLATMKALLRLNLKKTAITQAGLERLAAALPYCRIDHDGGVVEPSGTDADRKAAEWVLSIGGTVSIDVKTKIANAADLPPGRFSLTHVDLANKKRVTDADLARFAGCDALYSLYLSNADVTDAGIAHLKRCRRLARLELNYTKVGDPGLAHLASMKKLNALNLNGLTISEQGLAPLKDLKELNSLIVGGATFDRRALRGLKEVRRVRELTIAGVSGMTAADLAVLHELAPLRVLSLHQTPCDDAWIETFRAARPSCFVVRQ